MLRHSLIGVTFLLSSTAIAGRPTCPGITGEGCNSVCVYDSGTDTWTCDLDDNGASADSAASAVIVSDYFFDSATWDYVAWGVTTSGTSFVCTRNSTSTDPIDTIELYGGDAADDLCFQNDGAGSGTSTATLDLAGSTSTLDALMYGGDQEDEMIGSYSSDSNYKEELYGEAQEDDIFGDDGDDYIDGGTHGDNICGEGRDDTLHGGDGGDYIYGGIGNDELHGEGDGDSLFGNNNNDDIFGGDGTDILSGGANNDALEGQGDNDILDGNGGTNTNDGGAGADSCVNGSPTNCESSSSSQVDLSCPW